MIVFGLLTAISLACEQQTRFRSSLLSLFFGGRVATTGNASAVRRLPKIMKSFERVSNWASDVIFYLWLRICRPTSGSFSATFLSRKQVAGRSSSWVKPSKKSARNVCRYRAGKEKPETSTQYVAFSSAGFMRAKGGILRTRAARARVLLARFI